MTFTIQVKEEILNQKLYEKSELAALIKLSGSLGLSMAGLTLSVTTENAKIARHLYELIHHFYQLEAEVKHFQKTNLKKNRVYRLYLDKGVEAILEDLRLADSFFGLETGISPEILDQEDKARAYLRGAFLAAGSIRDPESGRYQLEIVSVYMDHAEDLAKVMQDFLLPAKTLERKKGAVTYLQRAEDILDFLILIGAMQSHHHMEEVKLLRETRNDLNRATNAEMANIERTVNASMKIIDAIAKIDEEVGLTSLPLDLQEIAYLRIQHPDDSISRLGERLKKPLSKSGVNHRLRKIKAFADSL